MQKNVKKAKRKLWNMWVWCDQALHLIGCYTPADCSYDEGEKTNFNEQLKLIFSPEWLSICRFLYLDWFSWSKLDSLLLCQSESKQMYLHCFDPKKQIYRLLRHPSPQIGWHWSMPLPCDLHSSIVHVFNTSTIQNQTSNKNLSESNAKERHTNETVSLHFSAFKERCDQDRTLKAGKIKHGWNKLGKIRKLISKRMVGKMNF